MKYKTWYKRAREAQRNLRAEPASLPMAQAFWESIRGDPGFDVRSQRRAVQTFGRCAAVSDEGLFALLTAMIEVIEEVGEYPMGGIIDVPVENRVLAIAELSEHSFHRQATRLLLFIDSET